MKKLSLSCSTYPRGFGFTLIELLVVIILIAIMAVTVLPKFFSTSGFEEFSYRDELITKLRAIQLRSMQQTNNTRCKINLLETSPYAIGLQASDTSPSATGVCKAGYAGETSTVIVNHKHNVIFTISEGLTSFSFSSLGRPLGCIATHPCSLTITISGENSLKIEINSEGYIHAI